MEHAPAPQQEDYGNSANFLTVRKSENIFFNHAFILLSTEKKSVHLCSKTI